MPTEPTASRPLRVWLGALVVAILWIHFLIGLLMDVQSFVWFLSTMATYALMLLVYLGWWLSRRALTWTERLVALVAAPAIGIMVGWASKSTIHPPMFLVLLGLPFVLGAWLMWTAATVKRPPGFRLGGLVVCLAIVWSGFLLIRVNGTRGSMRADIHLRTTPTAEQAFLAQRPPNRAAAARAMTAHPTTGPTLELRPGDWPGFRGPSRDGVVRGLSIALDWHAAPPKVLWKQRVGPAWSSMAIVDGRAFTQEQRIDRETVVCRDAATGSELWAHEDAVRFDEEMSGPGPRATPTFADGRLYTQGARGALNCLNAATGDLIWTRNVAADSGGNLPLWGFSSSPLVAEGRVIVFAAGEGKKGLLAYSVNDGALLWTADVGKMGYSSPQRLSVAGRREILLFSSDGLFAVDESDGKVRWSHPIEPAVGIPPVLQPCQTAPDSFILGHGAGFGAALVQLAPDDHSSSRKWVTRQFKPNFNDMVLHGGYVYGFDGTVFCCLDAATGKRQWRDGRYGGGQVLLLADQGVLIVTSEDGEAILLRCNPQRNEELGRVPVIEGKAWNLAAIAQNRLFMRSDAELACLEMKMAQ
jgi:outer membrane protein assembly factor BamB